MARCWCDAVWHGVRDRHRFDEGRRPKSAARRRSATVPAQRRTRRRRNRHRYYFSERGDRPTPVRIVDTVGAVRGRTLMRSERMKKLKVRQILKKMWREVFETHKYSAKMIQFSPGGRMGNPNGS